MVSCKVSKKQAMSLLKLMMRFNLCYKIENTKNYIAPQLLPNKEPEYYFPNNDIIHFQYKYKFMPKGIVTRFIVKMHRYIENNLVWKSGVVVSSENNKAEVVENLFEKIISIKIYGIKAKELKYLVRQNLQIIHSSFKNLEYSELIPCNCAECEMDNYQNHYFDLNKLDLALRKNKTTIECQNSFEQVDILSLLDTLKENKRYNRTLSKLLIKAN